MGFIADYQIPVGLLQLGVERLVTAELVKATDHQGVLLEPVARAGGFQLVVCHDLERQVEAAVQFVLPLLCQIPRANNHAALQVATDNLFFDKQPRHDGLAGAGVVGQQVAKGLAGQHLAIDGRNLVRKRIDYGSVDRQHGIEEVGQPDSLGLGYESEKRTIAVETPRAALGNDFDAGFSVAVEKLVGRPARGVFVREIDGDVPDPFDVDDGNQLPRQDAPHGGTA